MTILNRFFQFLRSASAADRADGARALVRAYLHSPLDAKDREAAESAMTVLLDDVAPQVRLALAEAVAGETRVPHHVVLTLAGDQPDIAGPILRRSLVLVDAELVDRVAAGDSRVQRAIAERRPLSPAVAAAIAEVGDLEACAALLENDAARIAVFSLARIVERHGRDAAVRDLLLARADLPPSLRRRLAAELAATLRAFVTERDWLSEARAEEVTNDALDRATILLAETGEPEAAADLVAHLAARGALNTALLLRALCMGHVLFFEEALVHLSGLSRQRVGGAVHKRAPQAFQAVYRRAGLPEAAFPAFQVALDVVLRTDIPDGPAARAAHARQILERVLTGYRGFTPAEADHLLLLLRRFAAEAAREAARSYAEQARAAAPLLLPPPAAA